MSLKSDIPFGSWVTVTSILSRIKEGNKRYWHRNPSGPVKCIFLGARLLSNGTIETTRYGMYGDEGYDTYFSHDEYIRGALVCPKSGKPFKTLLEDCRLIEEKPLDIQGIPAGVDAEYTSGTYLGIDRGKKP